MKPIDIMITGLLIVNLAGFVVMGMDKEYARVHAYRISEMTLMSVALCGGSIGIFLGMMHYRHKTRKPLFRFGVPIIFLVEAGCLLMVALTSMKH